MARVRWSKDALADLEEQLEYTHAQDPAAASRLAGRIFNAEALISDFPASGVVNEELEVREFWVPGTRLKLIYTFNGENADIIAVFHTSRDPADKPGRDK